MHIVSVTMVICTRNRAQGMRQTLDAIGRVHVPDAVRAEVLVVDNASTDSTREVV
jgi:glycosyltransferase involved in cell wall biosynthesis